MTEIVLTKAPNGALVPIDAQAIEWISKLKTGAGINASVKRHRNPAFHRKYFALLNLAFDSWEPGDKQYKGAQVEKNFDQFRNDITVLAGHYETSVTLKGEVRLTAKSISFSSMEQDDFDKLYSATINVILSRVLTTYTKEELDRVMDQIMGFV